MTGFVAVFLPFNRTFDLIMAIGGTLLFSGYIVYDTYMINKRLSPDEFIMGAISLYLDFINLCKSSTHFFFLCGTYLIDYHSPQHPPSLERHARPLVVEAFSETRKLILKKIGLSLNGGCRVESLHLYF